MTTQELDNSIQPAGSAPPRGPARVLLLSNSDKIGGGNRSLLTLANGLIERRTDCLTISPADGPLVDVCREASLPCRVIENRQPDWRHPLATASSYRRWRRILREEQIDVVHANDLSTARAICWATRHARVPLVCHVRFRVQPKYLAWAFRRMPTPDVFVFNSEALKAEVGPGLRNACPHSRQTVVYNAVRLDQFSPQPACAHGRPRIGIIANLLPVKGHLDFLEMAAGLRRHGINAEYWIVGEDIHQTGYRAELEQRTRELQLDASVRFLGHCPDVARVINQLDLVVCASHEEPFGRCLIEAMACQKPVVATRVGGIPEVIHDGVTGVLVPARDPQSLAGAVTSLLDSAELRSAMGQAGRDRVLRMFTADEHVDRILRVYDDVLGSKRRTKSGRRPRAIGRHSARLVRGLNAACWSPARNAVFRLFYKTLTHDQGRSATVESLSGLLNSRPAALNALPSTEQPYADLGAARQDPTYLRKDPVFITARFRSGSSVLWHLFRHMKNCTAYYEPLNERRWFDPRSRGARIDETHRGITDYWKEYEGLDCLGGYYHQHWIDRNLYMDGTFWAPDLKEYVERLIDHAPGRPVLQFNRIDFRLPWIRHNFPNSTIVHLYRHPRDQWCSSLRNIYCCPQDANMNDFVQHDRFYLTAWANDLKYQFPVLDGRRLAHPYQQFYLIWKLSYLFGRQYADQSVKFESLVSTPKKTLTELVELVELPGADVPQLVRLIDGPKPGKWRRYADDGWFKKQETFCESLLSEFLLHIRNWESFA